MQPFDCKYKNNQMVAQMFLKKGLVL